MYFSTYRRKERQGSNHTRTAHTAHIIKIRTQEPPLHTNRTYYRTDIRLTTTINQPLTRNGSAGKPDGLEQQEPSLSYYVCMSLTLQDLSTLTRFTWTSSKKISFLSISNISIYILHRSLDLYSVLSFFLLNSVCWHTMHFVLLGCQRVTGRANIVLQGNILNVGIQKMMVASRHYEHGCLFVFV